MRNDDIYIDCSRKRNGDNGGIVGFSNETDLYHFCKSSPLFRSFLRKLIYDSHFIGLCFACSYCRQSILADYRISPFHFRIIISRVVDLDFDKNTGSGHAGFGNDIDDAFHVIFISNSPLLILQYRVYCNTNRRKMQNPSLFYISSRISPDRQYSAQSITRWLEDPLNSRDIS